MLPIKSLVINRTVKMHDENQPQPQPQARGDGKFFEKIVSDFFWLSF